MRKEEIANLVLVVDYEDWQMYYSKTTKNYYVCDKNNGYFYKPCKMVCRLDEDLFVLSDDDIVCGTLVGEEFDYGGEMEMFLHDDFYNQWYSPYGYWKVIEEE